MDNDQRRRAREYLLRARIFRFFALVFAVVGTIIFLFLYFRDVEGNFFDALRKPSTILIIVIPYLPAVLFSWLSAKAEDRFAELLGGKDPKGPPEKP